jgi:DNA repair exonuclease SbcCD ATPase subunit
MRKEIEDQHRQHDREMSGRVPSHDLANKVAEIERLKSNQREMKDRHDRLGLELRDKDASLSKAEERISDLMAERATVLSDLEEFEKDLNTQRSAARRLTEELRMMQEEQTPREDYEGLKREYEAAMGQLKGLKSQEGDNEARELELARIGKEYKAIKSEMRVLERELRLIREERGELDQWKLNHVCES